MAARRWELSALVATNSSARTKERPDQTISRRNDGRTYGTTPDHEATSTTCLLAGLDRLCASISATVLSLLQVPSREASSSRTLAGHVSGRTMEESRSRPYRTSSSLHQRLPVHRHYNRLLHQMGGGLSCPLTGREHGGPGLCGASIYPARLPATVAIRSGAVFRGGPVSEHVSAYEF